MTQTVSSLVNCILIGIYLTCHTLSNFQIIYLYSAKEIIPSWL